MPRLTTYLHVSTDSIDALVSRAALTEELGFDGLFLADSHLGCVDPFQAIAVAARAVPRIRFGTAVTNMVFRDPTVLAGSAATVSQISEGRMILGLGTGDGTTYRLGRRPTRMADFEAGARSVRDLLAGRSVPGPIRLGVDPRGEVPVYLSVEGPKGLRAAGRVADGVILGTGFDLPVTDWARSLIAEGTQEVGRQLSDVRLMAAGMISVDHDAEAARARAAPRLANRAHHNFRHSLDTVPASERAGVERFMEVFDVRKPIEERVPPGSIPSYLIDRFSIAGTPEDCADRLRRLLDAGIDQVLLTPPKATFEDTVRAWAADVMPGLG